MELKSRNFEKIKQKHFFINLFQFCTICYWYYFFFSLIKNNLKRDYDKLISKENVENIKNKQEKNLKMDENANKFRRCDVTQTVF